MHFLLLLNAQDGCRVQELPGAVRFLELWAIQCGLMEGSYYLVTHRMVSLRKEAEQSTVGLCLTGRLSSADLLGAHR